MLDYVLWIFKNHLPYQKKIAELQSCILTIFLPAYETHFKIKDAELLENNQKDMRMYILQVLTLDYAGSLRRYI